MTRGTPTTLYGWENEANWRLNDSDSLDGSLSLEKSKYNTFFAGTKQNISWVGQSLDRTPAAVVSAGYNHTWLLGDKGRIKLRVNSRYSSSYMLSDFNNAIHYTQKAYTRSDLTVTYTADDQRFYAEAYARNLEDNIQATGGGGGFSAKTVYGPGVSVSTPRQIGLRLGYKY
jgi:iron complex outermembrane receptor protein